MLLLATTLPSTLLLLVCDSRGMSDQEVHSLGFYSDLAACLDSYLTQFVPVDNLLKD